MLPYMTRDMFSLFLTLATASAATAAVDVWPPPHHATVAGPPRALDPAFSFTGAASGPHLAAAALRYTAIVRQAVAAGDTAATAAAAANTFAAPLRSLVLRLDDPTDRHALQHYPSLDTDYSYRLDIDADGNATAKAPSHFGLMYAMETFAQLCGGGLLPGTHVTIRDGATEDGTYKWRGLMLDAGRRFIPVPTVENMIDTMAAVKLNVLHLHASDMCRWGVESKKYPQLTANLTGVRGGFYTQENVKSLVEYAAARGVRVVPEFDVPGHSRGLLPLESHGKDGGVHFCRSTPNKNQLFNDPAGETYAVVKDLLQEMSGLFPDDVFDIGCDETAVVDDCTLNSTFAFERKLFSAIATDFGRTPSGWEEAAFDADAATPETIVDAWSRYTVAEVIRNGWRAIESHSKAFYMTEAVPGGPAGWAKMWYDIATNVSAENATRLLGGEISMWTDTYCYEKQCGAFDGPAPVGAPLFAPAQDAPFGRSLGGMIWPRGYVGAAAFWAFNATEDPAGPAFVDRVWGLNDKLSARGALVCPSNCSCDQLTACGKPYLSNGASRFL